MSDIFLKAPCRSAESNDKFGEGIGRTRVARYDAVLAPDHYLIDATVILAYPGMPHYLDPYVSPDGVFADPLCVARAADVRRNHDQKGQITVTYQYSTTPTNPSAGQVPLDNLRGQKAGDGRADSPADLAPRYSWDWREVDVAAVKDARTGGRVKNTAGFPVNPPPTRRKYNRVLSYMRYEASYDFRLSERFKGVVNKDKFLGEFEPGSTLCYPIKTGERVEIGGRYWFPTNYLFEVHWSGSWQSSFPSMGVQQLVAGVPTDIINPTSKSRQPVTEPWPLKANGAMVLNPSTEDPALVLYWDYLEETFADLNIKL